MDFRTIKQQAYRFLFTVMGFLMLVILCAAADGSLFLPLALVLGLADLVGMNLLCGLAAAKPAAQPRRTQAHPAVSLRVVRGGRAA